MDPHYMQFERVASTSGYAGNIQGEKRTGGNPFEGARSADYPTPPLRQHSRHADWCRTDWLSSSAAEYAKVGIQMEARAEG